METTTMATIRTCLSDRNPDLLGRRVSFWAFRLDDDKLPQCRTGLVGRVIQQCRERGLYRIEVNSYSNEPIWAHHSQLLDWELPGMDS